MSTRRYEQDAFMRFGVAVGIPMGGLAHEWFAWLGVGVSAAMVLLLTAVLYVVERRATVSGGSPS